MSVKREKVPIHERYIELGRAAYVDLISALQPEEIWHDETLDGKSGIVLYTECSSFPDKTVIRKLIIGHE